MMIMMCGPWRPILRCLKERDKSIIDNEMLSVNKTIKAVISKRARYCTSSTSNIILINNNRSMIRYNLKNGKSEEELLTSPLKIKIRNIHVKNNKQSSFAGTSPTVCRLVKFRKSKKPK